MENKEVLISFGNVTFRQKQFLTQDLIKYLNTSNNNTQVETKLLKEKNNTQDAGTIISMVLNAQAIVSVANGIFNWLQKNREVELSFKKGESEFQVKNISSKDLHTVINKLEGLMENS